MARARKPGTREEELLGVGLDAFRAAPGGDSEAVLAGVAAMLAKAEVQRKRKPEAAPDQVPLPFSPHEFYTQLKARVGHLVLCDPVEHRQFGYLGGRLKQVAGLEFRDMDRVCAWIESGGLRNWSIVPTFAHVVQNIGKFIAYAREWERRGRQTLGGAGPKNVGAETESSPDLGGEFK